MRKVVTMLLAGMTFSTGLLLGLILHLPGAHSPDSPRLNHLRQHQQPVLVNRLKRSLSQHQNKVGSASNSTTFKDSSSSSPSSPEGNIVKDHLISDNLHRKLPSEKRVGFSGHGLARPISPNKQTRGDVIPNQMKTGVGIGGGVKGIRREQDTSLVNIEVSSREQGSSSQGKHSAARSAAHNKAPDLTSQTQYEIEIDLENEISKDRDFDTEGKKADTSSSHSEKETVKSMHNLGVEQVVDGVLWTPEAELFVPSGYKQTDIQLWREKVEKSKVVRITEGCGRMQNRLVTFSDGSQACARYRLNTDQSQGEIYSYILAQLLEINNVLPSVLQKADSKTPRWSSVDLDIVSAQWHPSKPVILTPWIDGLTPAFIPKQLRDKDSRQIYPENAKLKYKTPEEVSELIQWSDMIIFDYLTANLDRMVNNLFNMQWNSGMMQSPTHNLEKSLHSGHLVFLDNESGLFHSYRLLQKYSEYHEDLLKSSCVFRKQTVDIITQLHESRDIGVRLQTTFERQEPLWRLLPRIPPQNLNILQKRIDNVYQQIQHCKSRFPAGNNR